MTRNPGLNSSLPRNDEAEKGLVQVIIRSPDLIPEVLAFVNDPLDFYIEDYRLIFAAVLTLYDSGNVVNAVTVSEELDRRWQNRSKGTLNRIMTEPDYISDEHMLFGPLYAMIVHKKTVLRGIKNRTIGEPCDSVSRLVDEFKSVSHDLQYEQFKRLNGVLAKYQLILDDLCIAIRKIYWDSFPAGVPDGWLMVSCGSIGIHQDVFENIINYYNCEFYCKRCSKPIEILVMDRDDAYRYLRMDIVCESCSAELQEEDLANYHQSLMEKEREEQARKIAELRAMPYQEYLMTDHWKSVRQATLKRDDNSCRLCNSTERLQVHHRTYERRGCELPGDTTTLCEDCHQKFHERGKLARPD